MLFVTDFLLGAEFDYVPVADERAAILAADGLAAVTDDATVACVTHGPAITNTLTRLVEQVRSRRSVILLTGDTPLSRDYFQWIDLRGIADVSGAGYGRVWRPETAASDTARAIARARGER